MANYVSKHTGAQIDQAVAAVLAGDVGGSSVSIDKTLTQEGAAADAKATGERFNQLSEEIAVRGVTPEMYGAVGDGVTDDTAAIRAMMEAGGDVLLTKTYAIHYDGTINAPNVRSLRGVNGAKIILKNGATQNEARLFVLENVTLVEGIEFDLNNQNMAFVLLAGSGSADITVRDCKMYNLRDTLTQSVSCLLHVTRTGVVTMEDLHFENILKTGNVVIGDAAGAHYCIYCVGYAAGHFSNLTFREVHTVTADSNISYVEDGGGLYVVNHNPLAATYITNINGYNCCKRTIKAQCMGAVVVNGGNIYYDVNDCLGGICIINTEQESQVRRGLGIISGINGVNKRQDANTGHGFSAIIASTEELYVSDCVFDCMYAYAILTGHVTNVRGCSFVGNGVLSTSTTRNQTISIDDCEIVRPKGYGWLFLAMGTTAGTANITNCRAYSTDDDTFATESLYNNYAISTEGNIALNLSDFSAESLMESEGIKALATNNPTTIKNLRVIKPGAPAVILSGSADVSMDGLLVDDFSHSETGAVYLYTSGKFDAKNVKMMDTNISGQYLFVFNNCTVTDLDVPMEAPYIFINKDVTITNNTPKVLKSLYAASLKNALEGSVIRGLYNGNEYTYDKVSDTWQPSAKPWIALASPDGSRYKVTVGEDGAITATKI